MDKKKTGSLIKEARINEKSNPPAMLGRME